MNNPFFWLGVSILLVAISLMALLSVAIFTLQELARAARSAEKLLDTLNQELPATLRDLRLTGQEISSLTDDVSGGVQSARNVVTQVDKGLTEAKVHAQKAHVTTRSLFAGTAAALRVLAGQPRRRRRRPPTRRPATPNRSTSQASPSPAKAVQPTTTQPNPSESPAAKRPDPTNSTEPHQLATGDRTTNTHTTNTSDAANSSHKSSSPSLSTEPSQSQLPPSTHATQKRTTPVTSAPQDNEPLQ